MSATYIKGTDGTVSYINLDVVQKFYAADNGDGTWIVVAQYSDYAMRVITGTSYLSQEDANTAIESHLGLNLTSTF